MKVYTYGKKEHPSILLLPGTCCHYWSNFGEVIALLKEKYYVLCVSYDGFDETENTTFISMIDEVEKIESYILKHLNGFVDVIYGCSLGGSFVGLLHQRQKIRFSHGILGSSDLDQEEGLSAKLKGQLIAYVLYQIFQKGKLPKFMQRRLESKSEEDKAYFVKMLDMFSLTNTKMKFVSKKSIYNQFYSDLITPLSFHQYNKNSKIHVFYALKMGDLYLERYQHYFKNFELHSFDMNHEELLICYPKLWVEEINKIVGE